MVLFLYCETFGDNMFWTYTFDHFVRFMYVGVLSLLLQESELSKKRKECEGLEHEARKRQKRCLDLVSLF